jgi:hypothetical protein
MAPFHMQQNVTFYRIALSTAGAVIIGAFGLLAGAVWGLATGADVILAALIVGAIAAAWGAVCFQLTPTGGSIMENKTTVNYAVIALHGWVTAFACILALIVWVAREAV